MSCSCYTTGRDRSSGRGGRQGPGGGELAEESTSHGADRVVTGISVVVVGVVGCLDRDGRGRRAASKHACSAATVGGLRGRRDDLVKLVERAREPSVKNRDRLRDRDRVGPTISRWGR